MKTKRHFRSYDGTALVGTFVPGKERRAVVLLVHGITSSQDELGLFSCFAEHLQEQGLTSFRFDYRCHGKNKQPMESLTLSGVVNDIEAAATVALEASGASGIHAVGMSFGGGLSAFWASRTKMPVKSVAMWAPVLDYEEDILGQYGLLDHGVLNKKAWQSLRKKGFVKTSGIRYGAPLLNELPYISGTEGLKKLKCKSMIVHGDADTVVPFSASKRFAKLNPLCRLVNIPGTDHGFGVGDDEDLSSPETKAKHGEVYKLASDFIEKISKEG